MTTSAQRAAVVKTKKKQDKLDHVLLFYKKEFDGGVRNLVANDGLLLDPYERIQRFADAKILLLF